MAVTAFPADLAADLRADCPYRSALALTHARDCVYLHAGPLAPGTPPGASRLGGAPDAPQGWSWPQWVTPQGERVALEFLAQVDLTDLALRELGDYLPAQGSLAFFADLSGPSGNDHRQGCAFHWEVLHGELAPVSPPDGTPVHPAFSLTLRRGLSLPEEDTLEVLGLLPPEAHFYREEWARYAEICASVRTSPHQLFGWARHSEGPMEFGLAAGVRSLLVPGCFDDLAHREAMAELPRWELLAQFSQDDAHGVMLPGRGVLHYGVRDATPTGVSRTWAACQCC